MPDDFYKLENTLNRYVRRTEEGIVAANIKGTQGNPKTDNPRIAVFITRELERCTQQARDKKGIYYERFVLADQATKEKTPLWQFWLFFEGILAFYPGVMRDPAYAHWVPGVKAFSALRSVLDPLPTE